MEGRDRAPGRSLTALVKGCSLCGSSRAPGSEALSAVVAWGRRCRLAGPSRPRLDDHRTRSPALPRRGCAPIACAPAPVGPGGSDSGRVGLNGVRGAASLASRSAPGRMRNAPGS